ncbi:cation:proton antiporter [Blastococcus sp. TF02A-30]|uniref:cation:proton antiporter domain-containing protein n=1 Tax=Blastococcus sp. TF02A-30 TaxID=2250580 RepID=UPI000DEA6631|nr:cation:proton antiporter [Blastococcus sp. TF02A-30]RBY85005.1 sodium:proton exchanger [Blastococcus sp. TF02A-30]
MLIDVLLVAAGALGLAVAALSERLRRLPVSEPVLALAAGVLLGPELLGLLDVPPMTEDSTWLHTTTRLLLAVSVMAVALRYPVAAARDQLRPVLLLLAVAMPVMAGVTAGLAAWLLGVGLGAAVLIGAALCPTDPVLASSVVTGGPAEEDLPARDRQILSLESGANDGLALPLVLLALAVAGADSLGAAVAESVWQVAGAVLLGVPAGWLGGRALRAGEEHGSTSPGPRLLFTAVLAFAVLGAAGLVHVDGILAVFVAGLAFNHVATGSDRTDDVPIDEAVNRFLVLPLFVGFGAVLPWSAWTELGWRGPALVVGVLLLRRLPVLWALRRPLGLGRPDAVFLGWFGPIGVSALFYLAMEAERLAVDPVVLAAGSLVVAASTVVHGTTSAPGRVLYRRAGRGE